MQIALNEEERQTLVDTLNELLPNLREEVYKTEDFDDHEQLKRRETLWKSLIARLSALA